MNLSFSSRTPAHLEPNSIAAALCQARGAGVVLLDLTETNPTRCAFQYPAEILEALGNPEGLHYLPEAQGSLAAREALASWYAARNRKISAERVFLCASTSEAYSWLFKLLAEPGDEVLAPAPSYPLFEHLAALECVRIAHYPLFYDDGWHVDMHQLAAAVTPRTRAIVAVHPNNPTGSFLRPRELHNLAEICMQHGLALISDEVFLDYPLDPPASDVCGSLCTVTECPVFVLGGLSKQAGLPQMKIAWIMVTGPNAFVREASARLEVIADTYLSAATPAQLALPAWLKAGDVVREQILGRLQDNLRQLRKALSGSPMRVLRTEAGWSAVVELPRIASEQEWLLRLILECQVTAYPGYFFDFPREAFLVLSLLPPTELVSDAALRLRRLCTRMTDSADRS